MIVATREPQFVESLLRRIERSDEATRTPKSIGALEKSNRFVDIVF